MELLRTYYLPNDWLELEEEEGNIYAKKLLSSYGPFSVVLYSRVKGYNLFTVDENKEFPACLISFYTDSMSKISIEETAFKKMKKFIGMIPPPNKILEFIHPQKNNEKEMLFMKFIIDIMENYYKAIEKPLYTKLRNEVLPLALKFYSNLEEKIIKETNDLLRLCIDKSNFFIYK